MEAALGGAHHALDGVEVTELDAAAAEKRGFDAAGAADAPKLLGHFVYENFFGLIHGLMFGAEIGLKRIELGGFFRTSDQLLGVQAVLEGVTTGIGFADGAFWASRVLGIGAVDLLSGLRLRPTSVGAPNHGLIRANLRLAENRGLIRTGARGFFGWNGCGNGGHLLLESSFAGQLACFALGRATNLTVCHIQSVARQV